MVYHAAGSQTACEHHPRLALTGTHVDVAAAHTAEHNRLLRALPFEFYAHFHAELRPVPLEFKQVLVEPNVRIDDVYLIRGGVASMLATEQEGGVVEVGTIGNEGFVGLPVLLGTNVMPYLVAVQVEGDAWSMPASRFHALMNQHATVRDHFLRYAQYFVDQLSQAVACNRLHTVHERCARWLLTTHDRVHAEHFALTHEFIAQMLGVRRAGVTVALGMLQREGIIRHSRGRIAVLDRPGLERASCGCFRITREALNRLLRDVVEHPATS